MNDKLKDNSEAFSYTLNNDNNNNIDVGASPESLFKIFNQNTSFIKNSLNRTGQDVKRLHSDPNCKICTEDEYCGIC